MEREERRERLSRSYTYKRALQLRHGGKKTRLASSLTCMWKLRSWLYRREQKYSPSTEMSNNCGV